MPERPDRLRNRLHALIPPPGRSHLARLVARLGASALSSLARRAALRHPVQARHSMPMSQDGDGDRRPDRQILVKTSTTAQDRATKMPGRRCT